MQAIITPDQCRVARRELGLSQADVSNAVGINRQYVSEFETGYSNRITTAQLRKLRAFFEEKIKDANDNGEPITLTFGDGDSTEPPPVTTATEPECIQRAVLAIRHLAIDPAITTEQVEAILDKIAANDIEAEELLKEKAESGLFTDWSEATDAMLKGVFGLFAANYVLMRHLQGRPLVMLANPVEYDDIKTVADIFAHLFHEENAALVTKPKISEQEQEGETV